MTTDEKVKLIQEVGEEIITDAELKEIIEKGEEIIAYDGFEPSGQIHIAQGILFAINVNKMIKAGCKFKIYIADWHALANNKYGGDIDKIQTTGKYFIEVWKAVGMDLSRVEFVWASDLVKTPGYWMLVLQIGRTNALRRFIRTADMMGRAESLDTLTGANIIYSCMQIADIFLMDVKIAQMGVDQRKLVMLAREVGPQLGYWKPISISRHMLQGLGTPPTSQETKERAIELKMSKSKPDTAIFMTDTLEDIQRKISKAWCPEGITKENPILEYFKYIIFESFDRLNITELTIERPEKFGGTITISTYEDLEQKFANKEIHPTDLKNCLIPLLDQLIDPVRRHFESNENAKKLLSDIRSFAVTR